MNRKYIVAGLALAMICLIGWTARIVVGQPDSGPQPIAPPSPIIPASSSLPVTDKDKQLPAVPVPAATPLPPPLGGTPSNITLPVSSAPVTVVPAPAEVHPASEPTKVPAVTVEWISRSTARLGQPIACAVVVKNTSSVQASQVVVRASLPAGVTVRSTEPKATNENNTLIWTLDTLPAMQERRLEVQLVPEAKGDLSCQAFVTFTSSTSAKMLVREPKLTLKATGPEKVLLGDTANVTLTIANPGDGVTEKIKLKVVLPGTSDTNPTRTTEFDVKDLATNEKRDLTLRVVTKGEGQQKCEVTAIAEGNLTAQESIVMNVIQPRLDISLNGPKLRYIDRPATDVVKITNPCSAPMTNVVLNEQIPPGFKFVEASDAGKHDAGTRTVTWAVGELGPNQTREVNVKVTAASLGDFNHKASVTAARCTKAESEMTTRVEGSATVVMEVVAFDDPVEVGADTAYEVRVTNTGSKVETNLQLTCTMPEKMEVRSVQGAVGLHHRIEGKEIVFDVLPKLAPRADAIYRINVRGMAPGDVRFRARVKADSLSEPLLKEVNTKVYGDESVPH